MKNHYDRSISLLCPTCAAAEFEFDADLDEAVREYACMSCGLKLSRDEILKSNGASISAEVDKADLEILDDVKESFRKAFKGLKGWTLK